MSFFGKRSQVSVPEMKPTTSAQSVGATLSVTSNSELAKSSIIRRMSVTVANAVHLPTSHTPKTPGFSKKNQTLPPSRFVLPSSLSAEHGGYLGTHDEFDYTKSTTQHYRSDTASYTPKYRQIRETRNHCNYTEERQIWQDSVIEACVGNSERRPCPWIVYTCGPMGAGKEFVLNWMHKNGYFPLENIVHIDPNSFKYAMPEWNEYLAHQPDKASTLCQDESNFMAEIAQEVSMRKWQHIWIDGSLKDGDRLCKVFDDIRKRFPHYRIAIFYIYCSKEEAWRRCSSRETAEHRVFLNEFEDSFYSPDRSLRLLTPKVDFLARINNEIAPKLEAFEVIDRSGSFGVIKSQFANIHPSPSHFPQSLAPLCIQSSTFSSSLFKLPKNVLEDSWNSIITTKIKLKEIGKISENVRLLVELVGKEELIMMMSPAHSVNLDVRSRNIALIPPNAQRFLWTYPIITPSMIQAISAKLTQEKTSERKSTVGSSGSLAAINLVPPTTSPTTSNSSIKSTSSSTNTTSTAAPSSNGNNNNNNSNNNSTPSVIRQSVFSKIGIDETDPNILFLLHGGFIYFDLEDKVVAVNCAGSFLHDVLSEKTGREEHSRKGSEIFQKEESRSSLSRPASSFLQFASPLPLPDGVEEVLTSKGRWREVSLPVFMRSATEFAWIKPGEKFGKERLTQYGGFAFKLKEYVHLVEGRGGNQSHCRTRTCLFPLATA